MARKRNRLLSGIELTGYAAEGRSLARVDGKVVFVEGAVPGDVVDILLTREKKDWAEGRVYRMVRPSADRVEPFCGHFGVCGGCKWQMLPYGLQLEYKRQEVIDHLRRIGRVALPEIPPIIGSERTRHYRNKLEFTFSDRRYLTGEEMAALGEEERAERRPEPALGFHVPRYFDKVVDILECHLQPEPVNAIRNWIRRESLARGLEFYDLRGHRGWLRNLTFRICTTGEVMVNLVVAHADPAASTPLLEALVAEFPMITSLYLTVNPKRNDSIHDLQPERVHGSPYVTERLGGLSFAIGPKSFFQTNTRQAERLYGVVRDYAGLTGTEVLYDLYCGAGSIGLFCSEKAGRVVGVEVIAEAVADAGLNASLNGITHATFHAGDVAEVCTEDFFASHGRPDVIVTDPPRAGMHAALVRQIIGIAAPRVVYVSCNPATQARDLALLDGIYRVAAVQPVDMFPHTHHIENVVLLECRNL